MSRRRKASEFARVKGMAEGHALATWIRLTETEQSELLRMTHAAQDHMTQAQDVLALAGLAVVEDGRLHTYSIRRSGWGTFVAEVGAELRTAVQQLKQERI